MQKRRAYEKNKKLEGEKAMLEKKVALLAEERGRFAKEGKEIKFAKSTTGQVFEKKISAMEAELKIITKENQRMREELDAYYAKLQQDQTAAVNAKKFELFGTGDDEWDNAVAVKAKPKLFGDED